MSQLWQRREHRVGHETMIQLFPSEEAEPVQGRTGNLSQSGVFVNAPKLYDVGTELLCDLALPDEEGQTERLTVHGRVAWVYEPHDENGGMGIEFLGLSELDASVLRQLAGPPREDVQQLDVWFDGVQQPVRVEALPTPDGVKLRTSLPFLRLGSGVSFGGGELSADSARGMLQSVQLRLDTGHSVPCLELTVSPEHAPTEDVAGSPAVGPIIPGKTVHTSDAAPVHSTARSELQPDADEQDEEEEDDFDVAGPEDDQALADESIDGPYQSARDECSPADPDSISASLQREAGVEPEETLRMPVLARPVGEEEPVEAAAPNEAADDQSERARRLAVADQSERARRLAVADQLELDLAREQSLPPLPEPEDLASELGGDPVSRPSDDSTAQLTDPNSISLSMTLQDIWRQAPAPGPRTWLILGALALCGLTVAWTIHAGFWARLGQRAHQEQGELAATDDLRASPAGAVSTVESEGTPSRSSTSQAGGAVARPGATRPMAKRPGPVTLDETEPGASKRPRLQRFGEATVLTVPISGSTEGAQDYLMTDPPGLVVKLPRAAASLPHDDYRIDAGGFGVVWVRREAGGLHLRFHFIGNSQQHTLTLAADRVTVTLSPTGAQLARLQGL